MPLYNLSDAATGALIRARQPFDQQPADPSGKGWVWTLHTDPETGDGEMAEWDPQTRAFAAVARDAQARADRAAALTAEVKRQAEVVRLQYLTPGAGKANAYRRKEEEARAWEAAGGGAPADPALYPFANARAAKTGEAIAAVLALFLARANAWAAIGAEIDALEDAAVLAIAAAAADDDWTAMEAAGQVTWPSAE